MLCILEIIDFTLYLFSSFNLYFEKKSMYWKLRTLGTANGFNSSLLSKRGVNTVYDWPDSAQQQ